MGRRVTRKVEVGGGKEEVGDDITTLPRLMKAWFVYGRAQPMIVIIVLNIIEFTSSANETMTGHHKGPNPATPTFDQDVQVREE
jgi:hypothetical protein